jgi:hypothetical protein
MVSKPPLHPLKALRRIVFEKLLQVWALALTEVN